MKQKPSSRRRRSSTKSVLRLPDLEHAKAAVLNSLNSADAKRGYRHAIDEFVDWYCSGEPGADELDLGIRNSLCRRNQRKSTLANRFAKRIEARWFATVRFVSRSSAISALLALARALFLSRATGVSPRLSRASKDGCSTEKDVHLSIDP
jgi:hypothetical protein